MKFVAIIPARYASTRFPAKPLALLKGKPIIQHVYERVRQTIPDTFVAVDDERIKSCVESFGGKAIMTSVEHKSGTDRINEAYNKIGLDCDVVINVQGDEPFIRCEQLEALMKCFDDPGTEIATLVKTYPGNGDLSMLINANSPKVVVDNNMNALYFSRSVIPFIRGAEQSSWLEKHTYYKHIGIYAYRAGVLARITEMDQTPLELAESLEQLRWIENGLRIQTAVTDIETCGIDTEADLEKARRIYEESRKYK